MNNTLQKLSRTISKLLVFLVVPYCLIGCATLKPKDYGISDARQKQIVNEYIKDGKLCPNVTNVCTLQQRNKVIENVIYLIDLGYEEYSRKLHGDRAVFNIFSDVTTIGLSAAGTLTGAKAAKDTYSVLNAAFVGSKLSVDEHWFQKQGTFAIIRKMDAERNEVKTEIFINKKIELSEYTMEEAWIDLGKYFRAGTLVHALERITEEAGEVVDSQERKQAIIQHIANATEAFNAIQKVDEKDAQAKMEEAQEIQKIIENASKQIDANLKTVLDALSEPNNPKINFSKLIETANNAGLSKEMFNEFEGKTIEELKVFLEKNFELATILSKGLKGKVETPIDEEYERKIAEVFQKIQSQEDNAKIDKDAFVELLDKAEIADPLADLYADVQLFTLYLKENKDHLDKLHQALSQ